MRHASQNRHAELGSASTVQQAMSAQAEAWTLKQVQGDDGGAPRSSPRPFGSFGPCMLAASIVLATPLPVSAQSRSCAEYRNGFSVDIGGAQGLAAYAKCLNSAEQLYGGNSGPDGVRRCEASRATILDGIAPDQRPLSEAKMDEIATGFVWLRWCATDVRATLPSTVPIQPDWPQYGGEQ